MGFTFTKEYTSEEVKTLLNNPAVNYASRSVVVLQPGWGIEAFSRWAESGKSLEIISDLLASSGLLTILSDNYAAAVDKAFRLGALSQDNSFMMIRCMRDIGLYACGALLSRSYSKWVWCDSFIQELAGQEDCHYRSVLRSRLEALDIAHVIVGVQGVDKLLGAIHEEQKKNAACSGDAASADTDVPSVTISDDLRDAIRSSACSEKTSHRLAEDAPEPSEPAESHSPCSSVTAAYQQMYRDNPYVAWCTGSRLQMAEPFYNEILSLPDLGICDILRIYQVDPTPFSAYTLRKIDSARKSWRDTGLRTRVVNQTVLQIQSERRNVLESAVKEGYSRIAAAVPKLTLKQKHLLCRSLSGYPTVTDHKAGDTMREIIQAVGMSRSTFYKALNTASYGVRQEEKKKQDEEDLKEVLEVANYGGFEKGVRQIYMMLPDKTGKHFALSKVRRLLRDAGIRTKVRRPNRQHQMMSQYITDQAKPNLLQRRFRLYRPNQVRLTDVTYLNYGPYESLRAYGSSCVDPVTGKLIVFFISPNNDIQLALETLGKLSDDRRTQDALLHSDQGILYMTTEFQDKVAEMGMTQSMSKRGNCWDNAPQESFFSMFKQETSYRDCKTFEELEDLVNRYSDYYNNDRHQWDRKQMTPAAYEAYMEAMTEEEFQVYLAEEQEKYDRMKKRAKDLAIARNKTLGV